MKKTHRLAALALAVVVGVSSLPLVASAAAKGTINAANVNLRKSASTKSASLGKLSKNTEVELISQTGDWYKIKANGKTGYVMKTYVTRSGSSSSSSSSSTTSTSSSTKYIVTLKQSAYIYKTAKASSSNRLSTAKKGAKYDVVSQTSSFYKVKVSSSQVGYIQKKYCTLSKTAATTTAPENNVRPGDQVGYTTSTITKPTKEIQTTKQEVLNAMNWNLTQMNTNFTIKIKDYKYTMLPQKMSDLERYFAERIEPTSEEPKDVGNGVSEITYNIVYNDAGKVVQDSMKNKSIASTDTKALAIKTEAQKILKEIEGKSDYEKIVYIHDYIVKNCAYDAKMTDDSRTPYGVLVKKIGSCQGYAETTQMLFTLAGLENRFIWANAAYSKEGTHGFNKVKLDGKWYVVDTTVDDPVSKKTILPGRVKRDFLLVTDTVARQRYTFESKRYPACSTDNNWHKRNKLVATTQKQLETLVKAGVQKKQQFVSVWVDDYSSSKYNTAFAKKLGATVYNITTTPADAPGYKGKAYRTAIFFEFQY